MSDVGGVESALAEAQRVIFFAIGVIGGDLETKREEPHHVNVIDGHELAIFCGEDQRRRVSEIDEAEMAERVDLAV